MGILSRFLPKKEQQQKALNPNERSTRPVRDVLTPLPITYQQDTAYQSVSAVYTVVTYLINKFSAVPIRVYKVEDKEALKQYNRYKPYQFQRPANYLKARKLQRKALNQEDEGSDLSKLLQQPNPGMTSDLFFQTLFGFKLLKGEGFIWANRGEGGEGNKEAEILEMHPIHPLYMSLVPDRQDAFGILEWVISLPQQRVLPKEDVLQWRYPRFDFDTTTHIHLRGQCPLLAGAKDLEGVSALDEAYKSTYQNRGANGILMAKMLDATSEQVSKIIATINERINQNSASGSITGGAGEWDFFNLSMSATDLALIESKKFSLSQVANLYNAPAGIWDLSESANNNITQYRAQVYTDKICGEWSGLLNLLNTWLLPAFGMVGTHYIDADYSEVPDLQADMERMLTTFKDEWRITPNEYRELRGYEANPNPLMDEIWVPSGYKPIDDAAINIEDVNLDGPTTNNREDRA